MKNILIALILIVSLPVEAAEFAKTDKYINCVQNMINGAQLHNDVYVKIKVTNMYGNQRFAAKYLGEHQQFSVYELKVNIDTEFKKHNYKDGTRGMAKTMIQIFEHKTGKDYMQNLEDGVKYCSGDILHPNTVIQKNG